MSEQIAEPQQGNNPDDGRPEWLPENFKNPEDLVKSYNEAQSKIREQGSQLNAITENFGEVTARLEEIEAQQARPQQTNDPAEAYVNAIQQASEMGDYRTLTGAFAQIAQMAARNEVAESRKEVDQRYSTLEESQANEIGAYAARTLEQRYGDQFEQARTAMHEIAQANPFLIPEAARYDPQAAVTALDNIYKIATYGAAPAQPDASAAEQAKQAAQTATGAGTRVLSPDEAKQEWDAIRAAAQRSYWEPQQ